MTAASPRPLGARQRGVTLIEALVAFAVMAFGVLGTIKMQSTLRHDSDIAKQRSEATRIAQEEIETLRAFSSMMAYDGIASHDAREVTGYTTNTVYALATQVRGSQAPSRKAVSVTVRWPDRRGSVQEVVLHTFIAGIDPALSGLLTISPPTRSMPSNRPAHRASDG